MNSAKSFFTKGISAFQAERYQDALNFFTEAIMQDDQRRELLYSVYDSRAATYEKLNLVNDALRDCKSAIELAPARWQAYARAARLLLQIQRPDTAVKMADRALARLDANSKNERETNNNNNATPREHQQRRSELESIKATALSNLESVGARVATSVGGTKAKGKGKSNDVKESDQPCYASSLPTELLIEIFSLMIAQDCTALGRIIIKVCRRWRRVAWDCPALWSNLVLGKVFGASRHDPTKKAKVWLSRSKGRIQDLSVHYSAVVDTDWRENLEKELRSLRWDGVRALSIVLWDVVRYLKSISSEGALNSLQKLELKVSPPGDDLLSAAQNLTEMSLDNVYFHLESIASRALRRVTIKDCSYGDHHIFEILELQPFLEIFTVVDSLNLRRWNPTAEAIILIHLTHIDVSRCFYVSLKPLVMPNLRTLRISQSRDVLDSFSHLATLDLPFFEELILYQAYCKPRTLVNFLKTVPTLTRLELKGYQDVAGLVVEALAEPFEGTSSPQTNLMCPHLQHIDVSQNSDIKSATLVRLVKSRLLEDQEERIITPIQSLKIDGCPGVEPDLLPWFRKCVPMVSCVYLSKKATARRRGNH
ncbi:hypothetical protein AX15_002406 [Amanita polypyramis BW_CC]|nr:hypothetical protein AX15_002406 [Amanita polypyramis BW_CC]